MNDGSIRVKTKIDNKGAEADLKQLEKECEKTASKIKEAGEKAKTAFTGMSTKQLSSALQKANKELEKTREKIAAVDAELAKAQAETDKMLPQAQTEEQVKNLLAMEAQETAGLNQKKAELNAKAQEQLRIQQAITAEIERQNRARTGQSGGAPASSGTAAETEKAEEKAHRFRDAMKGAATQAKAVATAIGSKVVNGLKKAAAGAAHLVKNIKNAAAHSRRMNSQLGHSVKRFARLGVAMLGVEGVFGALRRAANAYMMEDQELYQSMQNTWATLGAFLAPAIEKFVSVVKIGVSYINQFAKALTGVDVIAKRNAKALQKQAEAANSLSSASFDEQNKLTDSSSGSDSTSSAFDAADVQLPEWLSKIVEMIRAHDWYGLGSTVAEGLNAGLSSIDWDAVKEKVTGFVTGLTDGINGFLDNVDFALVGDTIAETFNTITLAITTFFGNIDWTALGTSLATGLNSLFNTLDWAQLGVALTDGIRAAIEAMIGFVATFDFAAFGTGLGEGLMAAWNNIQWGKGAYSLTAGLLGLVTSLGAALGAIDWGKVAKDIGDMCIGLLDAITDWLCSIDWWSVGETIMQAIGDVFVGIDWNGVADSLSQAVGALIGALGALLLGACEALGNWLISLWNDTVDYFSQYCDWGGTPEEIFNGLCKGIGDAFKNIGKWIVDHIWVPFRDGFKKAFGIHSPSTKMAEFGGYLIDGLKNGIGNIWTKVKEKFNAAKDKITGWGTGLKDKAKSAGEKITSGLKTGIGNMGSAISDKLNSVKTKLDSWRTQLGQKMSSIGSTMKSSMSTAFEGIKNKIKDPLNGILAAFEKAINWKIGRAHV